MEGSQAMPTHNDRNNNRIFISRMVGVTFKNSESKICPIRNISLSGIFIVGQFSNKVGSTCTITLHKDWANRQFVLDLCGSVTRVEKNGIAVSFTEMDLNTFYLLQTLLLYESNNPAAMGEEFTKDCSFAIHDFRVRGNRQSFAGRSF
jgi:hypothetical protein